MAFSWSPQQLAIFAHVEAGKGSLNVIARAGTGKCLGKDTPVMMYNGHIKPVQDVQPGDQLMGPDSQPRTVQVVNQGYEGRCIKLPQSRGNHGCVTKRSRHDPCLGLTIVPGKWWTFH